MKHTDTPAVITPQITFNPFFLKQDTKKQPFKIKSKRPEIRIVYFGTPSFSALVLEKLIEFYQSSGFHPSGFHPWGGKLNQKNPEQQVIPPVFTIQAVLTQPNKPVGRKQTPTTSPVAQIAQKHNIPTLKPERLDEDFIKNHLSLLDSDLFILAAYGKLLPSGLLNIPTYGALNIHPSLLPRYRGPSPIQNAILGSDKISGVTIIKMDEEIDHGPVIITKQIRVSEHETFDTLSTKMFEAGADLLIKIIPDFVSRKVTLTPQNDVHATFTHLIKKEDGYFEIDSPPSPEKLDRMIRAYYPWPTAWTKWQGKIIKFLPGGLIQMEGKKPMGLKDFLRGYQNFPIKHS